jgi:amino acid adenylation domain-containing protein
MVDRGVRGFRLSPQQRRLWQLQRTEQRQPYRGECVVIIEGDLNEARLKTALQCLVQRHEILRTTFCDSPEAGEPLQVPKEIDVFMPPAIDFSHLPSDQQDAEIEALAQAASHKPFDLQQGPILQFCQVTLSSHKRVLIITLPALCADSITFNNIVQEIRRSYAACFTDDGNQVGESLQYAEISEVLNELLEAEDMEEGRAFWRKKDLSSLAELGLHFEAPRSDQSPFEPASLKIEMGAELLENLQTLAGQYEVPVSDLLLTCWILLLWRLSERSKVIIGFAGDGRLDEKLEAALGPLTKHIPLEAHLQPGTRFSQILLEISATRQEICEWQDYFGWNHSAKSSEEIENQPFFPFCFQFDECPKVANAENASFRIHKKSVSIDRFKINLAGLRRDGDLLIEFSFDSALYGADEINRVATQFQALLESIVANPESPICQLNILSREEIRRALLDPGNSQMSQPERRLHSLFEEQVARTPDSIAVVAGDEYLDYAGLNSKANQLANQLRRLGAGPDTLVAIYVERSLDMLVGILGILKTGGAYVPIDPAYPKQRISFMLDDTKAPVIATQRGLVDKLPDCRAKILCIDELGPAGHFEAIPPVNVPEAPAYVIYTSGSTGNPKGVVVSHSNVARLFSATRPWFGFDENDIWTLFHSFAFDFSVWEIWGALLFGGKLIVVPYLLSRSPENFYEMLLNEGVTVLNQTPSAFRQLLRAEADATRQDLALRFVIFGGEALEFPTLKPWFDRHGVRGAQLVNMYGITETTVHVTYRPVTLADLELSNNSAIGPALPDLQIYLFNRHGSLIPSGTRGEIYVGGAGLAAGYLNRADLTAQKFVPHEFSILPGCRLYRSGDLASYLSNGELEYIGRIDNQVKIRGFRIELGEIEFALREHASVSEAVVMLRDRQAVSDRRSARDDSNLPPAGIDKQIVAYVVCDLSHPVTVAELHRHLEERVPSYMTPSSYVMLRAFPLTVNGKLDREALPAPEEVRPELDMPFIAPRGPVESELAQIWGEFLHVNPIGIYDSFFLLGGHSLLMTQLASRIKEAFHLDIPLVDFFENPTIAKMANLIATRQLQQQDPQELAELLGALKNLSPSEMSALLQRES